jgi:hypothetical protein
MEADQIQDETVKQKVTKYLQEKIHQGGHLHPLLLQVQSKLETWFWEEISAKLNSFEYEF